MTTNIAWLLLAVAGVLEIVWSISMKASQGFTKHQFTAITLVAAGLSFWLLGLALRQLPVGTAYAVWTGIGAVGAAILGILLFNEPATLPVSFASLSSSLEFSVSSCSATRGSEPRSPTLV